MDVPRRPGLCRRLAAVFYDSLLLVAVLFVATAFVLPLNSGEAFTRQQIFYPVYLLAVSFLFFAWFWMHGGQTLGLKAWGLRVLTRDGQPITCWQAMLRFVAAIISWGCLGLGFAWILVDKNRRSWHDHLSKTDLVFAKPNNENNNNNLKN